MPVEPLKNTARRPFNICINLSNRTHFWTGGALKCSANATRSHPNAKCGSLKCRFEMRSTLTRGRWWVWPVRVPPPPLKLEPRISSRSTSVFCLPACSLVPLPELSLSRKVAEIHDHRHPDWTLGVACRLPSSLPPPPPAAATCSSSPIRPESPLEAAPLSPAPDWLLTFPARPWVLPSSFLLFTSCHLVPDWFLPSLASCLPAASFQT